MGITLQTSFAQTSLSLTSIFTPPSSCGSSWTYEGSRYNSIPGGLLIQNALDDGIDTDCFPSSFTGSGRQSLSLIYSPGYCPSGYATPAQFLNGATTTAVCCLSSFSYFTTLTTIDNSSPKKTFIFAGCISTYSESDGATSVLARANATDLSSAVVTGPLTMWAQPIAVAFQQKDLPLFTTVTSAPDSSSTAARPSANPVTQVAATATSLAPTAPALIPNDNGGLSSGAKAGIGVGAAVVVAFLIVLGLFLVWRRRKQRAYSEEQHMRRPSGEYYGQKDNAFRDGTNRNSQRAELGGLIPELDSDARMEMPDQREVPVPEMESRNPLRPRSPT